MTISAKSCFENYFETELEKNKEIINLARTFSDIEKNAADGKISALLALEGGEALEGKTENINHFYERGIRIITLVWNRENELGYGIGVKKGKGLKTFGVECVKLMEELGIIIDVSHLNEAGFWDVHNLTKKPYIASHSNVYSITPAKRNLKDEQIRAIAEKGGFIGINLCPAFLSHSEAAGFDDIMKHINRYIELGAKDNIGLGCDYDGIDSTPEGFGEVSALKDLAVKILEEADDTTSKQIMSDNFYNFLKRFSYEYVR